VLVLTLIFGFAIAAVSYGLVESPCREALRRWEKRRQPVRIQIPEVIEQVMEAQPDAVAI